MIPEIGSLVLLVASAFVAAGMLWRAAGSSENQAWNLIGALGWGLLAVSTFTNGFVEIGIAAVALAVLLVGVVVRWFGPDELPRMT